MLNLKEMLKEFLGLSNNKNQVAIVHDDHVVPRGNKFNEKADNTNEEARRMFEFDESLRKPYTEIREDELLTDRRPGEFLVEVKPADGENKAVYKAIRLDITAIFETSDEYNYTKYYKMASHSESFVTDLSTINFGTNGTDAAAEARIKRILAEPRYARTKLDFINLIEVDSTGLPLDMNIEKVSALYFMVKYKKFI